MSRHQRCLREGSRVTPRIQDRRNGRVEAWPLAARYRVPERMLVIERELAGNWEQLYTTRMDMTRNADGSPMALTPESIERFNAAER